MISEKGRLFIALLTLIMGISFLIIFTIVSLNGVENFLGFFIVATLDLLAYIVLLVLNREKLGW